MYLHQYVFLFYHIPTQYQKHSHTTSFQSSGLLQQVWQPTELKQLVKYIKKSTKGNQKFEIMAQTCLNGVFLFGRTSTCKVFLRGSGDSLRWIMDNCCCCEWNEAGSSKKNAIAASWVDFQQHENGFCNEVSG